MVRHRHNSSIKINADDCSKDLGHSWRDTRRSIERLEAILDAVRNVINTCYEMFARHVLVYWFNRDRVRHACKLFVAFRFRR